MLNSPVLTSASAVHVSVLGATVEFVSVGTTGIYSILSVAEKRVIPMHGRLDGGIASATDD